MTHEFDDDCGCDGFHAHTCGGDDDRCDVCGGELAQLGVLGNLSHLRCRNCGWMTSREATTDDGDLANLI